MDALYVFHLNQQETQRELRSISAIIISNGASNDLPSSVAEKYELQLPISTIEEFQSMEDLLEKNPAFRSEFKQSVNSLLDQNNILSRTLTNILKMYLERDVVLQFNAMRRTDKKELIFKKTECCKCILDIIKRIYKQKSLPLTEKEFFKALGPVITNAIDWDGNRAQRTLKKKELSEAVEKTNSEDTLETEKIDIAYIED
ncbi:uncharacterized protein LOC122497699 [Leptopilina heterotoma]|uniref:uncharacterized protein LOC122497699 n=1 Tax=Leptopilina heterotoma TaxID=63436 RepID=UPI001CA8932D|nr:uncharacterized protein LOC122497699 [Leptopilina heterotoma]